MSHGVPGPLSWIAACFCADAPLTAAPLSAKPKAGSAYKGGRKSSSFGIVGMGTPTGPVGASLSITGGASGGTAGGLSSGGREEGADDGAGKRMSFLVVWRGEVSMEKGETIYVDGVVTCFTFGRMDGHSTGREDIMIVGMADGRILVSLLPLPVRLISPTIPTPVSTKGRALLVEDGVTTHLVGAVDAGGIGGGTVGGLQVGGEPDGASGLFDGESQLTYLDTSRCIRQYLHANEVTTVGMSQNGHWIFTTGSDGCIFMLSTSLRAKEMVDCPDALSLENSLIITEKAQLHALRARMEEVLVYLYVNEQFTQPYLILIEIILKITRTLTFTYIYI